MMNLIKRYWYYACILAVFSIMFYAAPPLCDRWMENTVLLETGGILRYLCGEIYWVKNINVRFISNIFSYFVDRNIVFRSICNGMMIVLISLFCVKISGVDQTKDKTVVGIFSAFLLMLVSWGIKAEVYLYAATLYLSAFLLVGAVFYLNIQWVGKTVSKGEKAFLYILIVIGSLWLECNIPMIVAATGTIWLIQCCKSKKIMWGALSPLVVSLFSSLAVFYADKRLRVAKAVADSIGGGGRIFQEY